MRSYKKIYFWIKKQWVNLLFTSILIFSFSALGYSISHYIWIKNNTPEPQITEDDKNKIDEQFFHFNLKSSEITSAVTYQEGEFLFNKQLLEYQITKLLIRNPVPNYGVRLSIYYSNYNLDLAYSATLLFYNGDRNNDKIVLKNILISLNK